MRQAQIGIDDITAALDFSELDSAIYTTIRTAPAHIRRDLTAKTPMTCDAATAKLTALVLETVQRHAESTGKPRSPGFSAGGPDKRQ